MVKYLIILKNLLIKKEIWKKNMNKKWNQHLSHTTTSYERSWAIYNEIFICSFVSCAQKLKKKKDRSIQLSS